MIQDLSTDHRFDHLGLFRRGERPYMSVVMLIFLGKTTYEKCPDC